MRGILFSWLIVAGLIAAGCSDPEVTSFSEVNQLPGKAWEQVDPALSLQMLNSKDKSYIVFQSEQAVEADYEIKDNMVIIKLEETVSTQGAGTDTHVYELTTDAKQDTIEVRVNGEQRPFDSVTGF
ncbi:hypothetical protein SAMN04488127_2733 [Bhargavaea ginsengi]|uniref:Uncharacterized protein n=1 Tax=Bhargavaea ginsengi TaxID=426757 RepID=A0A1H7BP66_9BACL|nr:hypothetical protein [Bhargavaea ginsengi]SEJ76070.1 hypothetical protein SAMN04488127_2733 [Bhargavaea ginsengi]